MRKATEHGRTGQGEQGKQGRVTRLTPRVWRLVFVAFATWIALAVAAPVRSEGLGRVDPDTLIKSAEEAKARKSWDEAESLFRRAMASARKAHGNNTLPYANVMERLGRFLLHRGQTPEAEGIFRDVVRTRRAHLPADDWKLAAAYNDLSRALEKQQNYPAAADAFGHSVAIFEKRLGKEHLRMGAEFLHHAKLLRKAGREAEARKAEIRGHRAYAAQPMSSPPPPAPR